MLTIIMNDTNINSIEQLKELKKVDQLIKFETLSRKEAYQWITETLNHWRYFSQKKKEKNIIRNFILQMTGYSRPQLARLIKRKKETGLIFVKELKRSKFKTIYTVEDTTRLIETDNAHGRLSGPATKKIFERMFEVFKDERFVRLKNISVAHLYNLRKTRQYQSWARFWSKTKATSVNIGERRKPEPLNKPGFIRIDTVHQGDLDKEKGVYHINLVDEVLQWEIVASVPKISEYFLLPVLEKALGQFPFKIINLHSDNGSEYINHLVAKLLNKLLISQTKSRARHCNDNALVESKNGSVIRKIMGRNFIAQRHAQIINQFYQQYLNVYLNFHRPCGFATEYSDPKGKIKKRYDTYLIPYEKLKSLPGAEKYLKLGVTFSELDKLAHQKSDNQFAAEMQKAKVELFKKFKKSNLLPTNFLNLISVSSLD